MKNTRHVKPKRPKRANVLPGVIVRANQAGKIFPYGGGTWDLYFYAIEYDKPETNSCYTEEKVDGVLTYWGMYVPIGVPDGELIELCSNVLKACGRNQYVKVKIPKIYGDQEFMVFYNEIKNLTELV